MAPVGSGAASTAESTAGASEPASATILMFVAIPKVATKELAPKEDQGVIFGIITAPANATIDDTIRYADAAGKVF